jgi:hypothetical protein
MLLNYPRIKQSLNSMINITRRTKIKTTFWILHRNYGEKDDYKTISDKPNDGRHEPVSTPASRVDYRSQVAAP